MKRSIKLGLVIFAAATVLPLLQTSAQVQLPFEAPTGFDNKTNGFLSQRQFEEFMETFEEVEDVDEGVGPLFNDTGCANCHSIPVTGGGGLTLETRAASFKDGKYVDHPGGSLVRDHVTEACADLQPHVLPHEESTLRASLSILGDGFIEAIADETIVAISKLQSPKVRGLVVQVPVLEANNALRVGRFGWKNQHASLESFSGDAYLNEMGITNPLVREEATSDGRSVATCDTVPDPEDDGGDLREFANFMRATKAPPRGPISPLDNLLGTALFVKVGCAACHVPVLVTAPVGTPINGGAFRVPPALGSKIIHPYGDFLLHDVGTSDPIIQNGGPNTYNKVRTPPLWGLRTRTQLMHDGQSTSITDAIGRHRGQAADSSSEFSALSAQEKRRLLTFLGSL